ncbi:MAG TPA: prephenate dehydrogenase [Chitinophagaceae bacterium]|nr:prephenate dehydrogenase [Chitinophagaceae bacterium]
MKITIIGLGLIGGSLSISLREKGFCDRVTGIDQDPANLEKAISLGLVDGTAPFVEAIRGSDLIFLAIPVDATVDLLPEVLDLVGPGQVVADMGSVKGAIAAAADRHPNRGRFVSLHPMAGTEFSGPAAAVRDLFRDHTMVFCDSGKTDSDALELMKGMANLLEMRSIYLEAPEHDLHAAYVSHISHITSFALALTVLEKEKEEQRIFELASGGFESTVRLAKSSADMWVPIFRQNKTNVLDVLQEHIRQLNRMKEVLEKDDYPQFYNLIHQSNKISKILR